VQMRPDFGGRTLRNRKVIAECLVSSPLKSFHDVRHDGHRCSANLRLERPVLAEGTIASRHIDMFRQFAPLRPTRDIFELLDRGHGDLSWGTALAAPCTTRGNLHPRPRCPRLGTAD